MARGDERDILFRSQLEIGQLLDVIARQGVTLWAGVDGREMLFLSRLLHVDPEGNHIVISYNAEKSANRALLAATSVTFHASVGQAYFEFAADQPSETVSDGINAVRLASPTALLRTHRLEHSRFRSPPSCHFAALPTAAASRRLKRTSSI